jgi:hypothetical protein
LRVQATNSPARFEVTTDGAGVVGHAGAALLRELADRLGLTSALGWQLPGGRRRHVDAHVLRDLAVLLADGGDCLSDLAVLREQPELFGPVASTPTAWRVVERVDTDPRGLARIRAARAHARARAWAVGAHPDPELLVIDADATLVTAHSDLKEGAEGTYRHTFGFHPLLAYLDRGQAPGEPLAGVLRPGNASAGSAEDLIELVDLALAQLPRSAADQPILVRSDSAGASTRLAWHLRERAVGFSLGMPIDQHVREAILAQPERAWTPAIDADGQPRTGAEVCELTGWIDLHRWPDGTRVLCRREDAHPAPSCASPILTATASRSLSPTSPTVTSPAWSCATASVPASRTASAPPRPPACGTCRSTPGDATRSGWSWSWPPKTCCAGPRRCWWTARSRSPNPRRCATGSCTSPRGSCATPAGWSCGCRPAGHGLPSSPARSPGCAPCRCAADRHQPANHTPGSSRVARRGRSHPSNTPNPTTDPVMRHGATATCSTAHRNTDTPGTRRHQRLTNPLMKNRG